MSKSVEKKKKAVRFFKNKNKKSKKNCKTLLTLDFRCAIIPKSAKAGENLGVAQLVARYLGVVEAARSSRVTQTKAKELETWFQALFVISKVPERRSARRTLRERL